MKLDITFRKRLHHPMPIKSNYSEQYWEACLVLPDGSVRCFSGPTIRDAKRKAATYMASVAEAAEGGEPCGH